jgi:hypothetical protein
MQFQHLGKLHVRVHPNSKNQPSLESRQVAVDQGRTFVGFRGPLIAQKEPATGVVVAFLAEMTKGGVPSTSYDCERENTSAKIK